jgi:hypothetical protein
VVDDAITELRKMLKFEALRCIFANVVFSEAEELQ